MMEQHKGRVHLNGNLDGARKVVRRALVHLEKKRLT